LNVPAQYDPRLVAALDRRDEVGEFRTQAALRRNVLVARERLKGASSKDLW